MRARLAIVVGACLVALAALAWPFEVRSQTSAANAGAIAALACKGPTALMLFARQRGLLRGGWALIGDTRDDDEPLLAAALRGFHEETNCLFDLDQPRVVQLAGPSRSDKLAVYAVRLPYASVAQIAASRACRGDEYDQWVWIERAELLAALKANEPTVRAAEGEPKSVTLTPATLAALRQALADKLLPEDDPCGP